MTSIIVTLSVASGHLPLARVERHKSIITKNIPECAINSQAHKNVT